MEIDEKPNEVKPRANCVHCGQFIEANSREELWQIYSDHVKAEHGKPDMRNPDGSYRYL